MRRALAFALAACCVVAAGQTTASAAGQRSRAAAKCGVSATVEVALERAVGTRVANRALRACAVKGGVRAMRAHPPTDRSRPERAHAAAVNIVVDNDGFATDANCNAGATAAETTIDAGLALAAAGDSVLVCPGSYAGGVAIPDGVTLRGIGATQPIVGCGPGSFGTTGAILDEVDDATIQNLDFEGGGTCGTGIQVLNAIGSTVTGNTINGSQVGILSEFAGFNQFGPDNSITARETGILEFLTDGDTIVDNHVGEAPSADIALIDTGLFDLGGNVIEKNSLTGGPATRYGIFLDFGDLTHAEGNVISGHAYGVWVEDSLDVVVTKNLIHGNDYGLVNIATGSECEQQCKRSRAFGGPVPDLVDGTRNWWGSATGPGDWGIGTGDEVSAEVDFFPWALNNQLTAFRACDKRITIPGSLRGTIKSDVLCGSGGDDTINGRKGADLIIANNGDDVISGKEGQDSIIGAGGDDFVTGNTQFDSIQGRGGGDVCWFNGDGGQTSSCERFGIGPSR